MATFFQMPGHNAVDQQFSENKEESQAQLLLETPCYDIVSFSTFTFFEFLIIHCIFLLFEKIFFQNGPEKLVFQKKAKIIF